MSNNENSTVEAVLVLSGGERFHGTVDSESSTVLGELKVVTELVGFQEHLYDQNNHGRVLLFTTPHVGITGANSADATGNVAAAAAIVREPARMYSNFRAERSLFDDLKNANMPVMRGIDTRALTRAAKQHERETGNLPIAAIICGKDLLLSEEEQIELIKNFEGQGL